VSRDEKQHKHPEWYPFPPGVFTAFMFGSVAVFYLLGAYFEHQWVWGVLALGLGAIAIFEVGSAAYTAGLRRESRAQQLRREWSDAESSRATRPGISASGEGVCQEDEEEEA
jgi:hypothetical protein